MPVLINPVVRGVAPDPSVCRVGDDFFLATSTMDFWPGIPIRHSRDLVHWTVVGHAVVRPDQYRRDGRPGPLMLYAPTLRHHAGTFWLACTNVADQQGNFILSSQDPAATWSAATWVDDVGFDPSLAFDDGRDICYYTRRTLRPEPDGLGPIVQAEIDLSTGRLAGPPQAITPGRSGYRSNDIEGPHLYSVNGWWYLFCAEGGTWKGHMQTVGRSRSPWGPFEGCPDNPVLTHRHLVGDPVQTVGHADLVQDAAGAWWAVHLATRHDGFSPHHQLGRETFLAPVHWVDGWPVVGTDGTVQLHTPLDRPRAGHGVPARSWPHRPTAWTGGWSTLGEPSPGLQIRRVDDGWDVALPAPVKDWRDVGPGGNRQGEITAYLRQEEPVARLQADLDPPPASPGAAGIVVHAAPRHRYVLTVSTLAGVRMVVLHRIVDDLQTCTRTELPGRGPVRLMVDADPSRYTFSLQDLSPRAGGARLTVGSGSVRSVCAEATEDFTGVRLGVLARGTPARLQAVSLRHDTTQHHRDRTDKD